MSQIFDIFLFILVLNALSLSLPFMNFLSLHFLGWHDALGSSQQVNAWASFMLFYNGRKVVFEFTNPVERTRSVDSLAAIRPFPVSQLEPGTRHENPHQHPPNTD